MFNTFDNNCCFNHLHTLIKVKQNNGEINEVVKRTLDLCKNFLAIQCELLVEEPSIPIVLRVSGVRYNCKRVCDLTGNTLEFVMEFLTSDEESTSVIRCTHWHGENSYEFFRKTMDTLRFVIENNVSDYEDHSVIVLHPCESKLAHTMKQNTCVDPHAYSACHPGISKPLSLEQVREEWEIIKNYFSLEEKSGLSIVTSLALKGKPVPLDILDMVLSCDVTIDLIICLIAIFTCNPLIPYESLKINYQYDERLYRIITEASQKDELCKRQLARLLYTWKIRDIPYGVGIDIQTECLFTQRILELI